MSLIIRLIALIVNFPYGINGHKINQGTNKRGEE